MNTCAVCGTTQQLTTCDGGWVCDDCADSNRLGRDNATRHDKLVQRAPQPLKQSVSPTARQQVLHLRRHQSLSAVAKQTGLPLGTVKTICARSGAFKDNQALRALFSLPPIQQSTGTELVVPELPPQASVTGDKEIDAVLWLREVIKSGQPALIERAMLAAKRIKTPLKELADRYTKHLVSKNPENWTVAFTTFGFDDLTGLAEKSIKKAMRRHEAISRFGSIDKLFDKVPAEEFCIQALHGLKFDLYDAKDATNVDERFQARPDLMPHTLSDCMHELSYWRDLHWLRSACDGGDQAPHAYARERFTFRSLAHIRPRSKAEALDVFRYMANSDHMNVPETQSILLNLIG